ncbi:zinc-dependent metalloprotease family protein [Dyella sp.]|uniref:zinc-dependent metalloprotease family protein n=1 Tax=Dyella sp. TaxID=1869338 RepID=UPI002ED07B42
MYKKFQAAWIMCLTSMGASAHGFPNGPLEGHFIAPELLSKPTINASHVVSPQFTSPILHGLHPDRNTSIERHNDYTVSSATLRDEANRPQGSLVMVRHDDGHLLALVETPQQSGMILADGIGTQQWFDASPADYMQPDAEPMTEPASPMLVRESATDEADVDSEGFIVIDLLAGFSRSAADRVGDPQAFALAQVESVNLGLRNSQVEKVRLRLAGIQIIEEDYPVHNGANGALKKALALFDAGMKQYGADLLASYFNASSGNNAAGWAYIGGRVSVQQAKYANAFRHEIAHNVGGSHCNTGQAHYKFGYNNGNSKTILCGNSTSFYSTPLLLDDAGLPRGNPATADMARLWRERAAKISSLAKAVVPLD